MKNNHIEYPFCDKYSKFAMNCDSIIKQHRDIVNQYYDYRNWITKREREQICFEWAKNIVDRIKLHNENKNEENIELNEENIELKEENVELKEENVELDKNLVEQSNKDEIFNAIVEEIEKLKKENIELKEKNKNYEHTINSIRQSIEQ